VITGPSVITVNGQTYRLHNLTANGSFNNVSLTYNIANLFATQSTAITGTGRLTFDSAGTLILTASNTYSGGTTISAGTLQVGASGTTGGLGPGTVTNNATLAFNRSDAVAFTDAITGTGSLIQRGSGVLELTAANTYAGTTTISSGTLQIGEGGTLGSGAVFNNAALVFSRSDSLTAANAISGTGSLTKLLSGTVTLSGSNSYSGGTTVSAGRLVGTTSGLQGTITNDAAVTFDQSTSGTYAGSMAGTGSLVKSGLGAVTFSGSNAIAGGVAINAGTLAVGSANALGSSGTISFGGGTLQYTASNATDYSSRFSNDAGQVYAIDTNGRNVTLAAALTSSGGAFAKLGSGTLTLGGANAYDAGTVVSGGRLVGTTSSLQGAITNNAAVELAQATDGTYAGAMDGTGSLTKSGAGTVTLSGSNSYSGGTVVSAGRLIGTTSSLQGAIANAAAVEFAQGGDGTYSAAMSGTGSLTKSGAGAVTLLGTNSYSGGTVVSAGRLIGTTASLQGTIANAAEVEFAQSASGTFAGTLSGAGDIVKTGVGTLVINAVQSSTGMLRVREGTVTLGTNGTLSTTSGVETASGATLNLGGKSQSLAALSGTGGTIALESGALTVNNATSDSYGGAITGNGTFTKSGVGTLTLSGSNSYVGTTTISAGRLVGSTASLPGAIANASQLEFAQASAGTFASAISGTGSFAKTGAGNLILTGSSSYTGATSVAAGRLSVNGALGNSPVTVLALAELGGSGSIAGPVNVANGGTLSPGNSIASLATGTATFASSATFEYEVDSSNLSALGTAADLLVVNGDLNIGTGTLLTLTDLGSPPNLFVPYTTIFALINYTGTWNSGLFTYGTNVLSDGERFYAGIQEWEIDYNATSGGLNFTGDYLPSSSFVTITAVPEPSTLALMAIGAGLAAVARFRANRRALSRTIPCRRSIRARFHA
jgi:autotransporter-associated beta strand protein